MALAAEKTILYNAGSGCREYGRAAVVIMIISDSSQSNYAHHVGRTVGKYTLESLIGRGGMAEVYKSTHPELSRPLAIKILHPFHTDIEGFVERFRQEAKAIATLRHPHIVQVYDFATTEDGLHYMVMEFIDGMSLDHYLEQHPGPLPLNQACTLFRQVAEALHAAHEKGIIHRDVKPSNILIDRQGTAYLTDFGIAQILGTQRLTMSYMSPGTPSFMAPEQGTGQPITRAVDVYALGGLLYQLLTGRLPYEDENPISLIMRKSSQTPVPPSFFTPSLPVAVDEVILRAMALRPQERYGDALSMLQALEQARGLAKKSEKITSQVSVAHTAVLPAWMLHMAELPHYKIQNLVSENQHTQRFLAYNITLEQLCFLDVLRSTAQQSPDLAAQFRQHWQGVAQVSHPNLAAVTNIDLSLDHRPFVAFEHAAGMTLAQRLEQSQPIPWDTALQIVRAIAQALAAAQEVGLVHQDLHPAHIVLREEGEPVLIGLGGPVATARNGAQNGDYAAPEKQQGLPVSVRSNVYSLGLILWEMLTGQHAAAQSSHLRHLPAGLPAGTAALLRRCLQPQPETRPASWAEFLSLLDAASEPDISEMASGETPPPRRLSRRPLWPPLVAALAVIGLLAGAVWAWRTNLAATDPETGQRETDITTPLGAATAVATEEAAIPILTAETQAEPGIFILISPSPYQVYTLAETVTFSWEWLNGLAVGQQFVVYLAGPYGRFPLGVVSASSTPGRFQLALPASEMASAPGEYEWQVVLETAVSGTVIATSDLTPLTLIAAEDPTPAPADVPPPAPADIAYVRISHITYNPPGDDAIGEFVRIINTGATAVDMTGWTLQDDARTPHVYTFPPFTLGPDAAVQVWTGSGPDSAANLYWRFGFAIWNNDGDVATLYTAAGELVSQCAYTGGAVFYNCP